MRKTEFSPSIIKYADIILEKCMGEEAPACESNCPMNVDVKGYVSLIGEKKYEEALKVIREDLFLPNTLGRICTYPCESHCRRGTEFNEPIAIAALKRFVVEKADKKDLWDLTISKETDKKIAIVGAGPAGAQAAIDLRKKGHEVTIFDKLNSVGGMMRVGIQNYRLPKEIIDYEYSYLNKLGIKFNLEVEIGKDIKFNELKEKYHAVLLAHGAHKNKMISIPGHKAEGVFFALEYLKEIRLTEKFQGAGKSIMIIGSGYSAIECARCSVRINAEKVYLCSPKNYDKLKVSKQQLKEAEEEGVIFNTGWTPIEIINNQGKVTAIKIQNENESKIINIDTVIMATGEIVEDITENKLKQVEDGRYSVDIETLATEIEKVFVAGDAAGGQSVIEAMALGRKAAISIDRFLNNVDLKDNRNFEKEWSYETKLKIPLPEDVDNTPRIHTNIRPVQERKRDFNEVDLGFNEKEAIKEASRCLKCECKLCMKECVMMNDFGNCPKDFMGKLVKDSEMDPLLAYSCNQCGLCQVVCPNNLPMKKVFMDSRIDFANANKKQSPIKNHRGVTIHQWLSFSKFFTTKTKGGKK
jgi:NADPH-dependent glutamate synthase beta subunit-like oxidoreductase